MDPVMMATGLLLWWPRRLEGQTFRSAFRIRFGAKGRKRWRDMHAVPGAVFAGIIAFLVVTGLPWSQFWGDRWSRFTEWVGSGDNAIDTPLSEVAAADLQTDGLKVEWANQRKLVPVSQHEHGGGDDNVNAGPPEDPKPISLDRVEGIARKIDMKPGYAIGMPDGKTGSMRCRTPGPMTPTRLGPPSSTSTAGR